MLVRGQACGVSGPPAACMSFAWLPLVTAAIAGRDECLQAERALHTQVHLIGV